MSTQYKEMEFDKNLDWKLWKNMLRQAIPFKQLLLILGSVMIFMAGIDSLFPLMTRYAIDKMIIPAQYHGLTTFVSIYLGLILISFLNVFLLIDIAGRVETGINYELRKSCYAKLQSMSFSYYDKTPTGWIVARLTSDISRLGDVVAWGIVDLVWGFAILMIVSVIIFVLNWKLALIIVALLPVMIFIGLKFQVKMIRSYRLVRKFNSQITNSFGQGIHGAKTTKSLVRENANLDEFMDLSSNMYRSSVRAAVASALFMPLILFLSSIGTGMIVWFGGSAVVANIIGYGTLVAFISYTMQLFEPISNVARIFAEMQNAQAAAERVFSLLDLNPEIANEATMTPEWQVKRMRAEIELKDMSFSYKEGKPIFEHFNLSIRQGESIALVGETGTGKTTLVNLICRFYEPTSGSVLIDGTEYQNIPMHWIHSQIGYVQQTPHLFQGTIRENIRYGKLDATDEEVEAAAKQIKAHDFIIGLPDQYDYQVGQSGNLLSTGQKQLIAFARVVLANPALLILDEATASIDTETELLVQDAIHKILMGRTSIIVAHRLSTIREVDRILLMHRGKVIEEGNHKHLMKQKGFYHKLYMNQFMQEAADIELAKEA